ncbi:hypothetical protein NBT05_02495 [Aquimarina sp. ERC-38]|uniref:hypothetical protein n=1 Tax=Aquimarina sp. ERC-38 TaxID=2949996 RepID=UPI002247F7E7|nr:hypothetical protein [Aquimarina sp. ERC-38]UZO81351.1 hypothetical protein NBT05_02495 [Aquimarina sp. ERC-38]
MRNFLSLLTILMIILSCSNDDSTEQEQNSFPTNIEISLQSAEVGDSITIDGNGFLTNETYVVKFTENITATIIEIDSNFLKVIVPENAISGIITLTYNNQTENIGEIEIITEVVTNELFLFKRNYESGEVRNFVKYDLNTSMETVLTQLGTDYFDNFSSNGGDISSVYYPDTNEVIALVDFNTLLKINTSNGTISTDILSNSDYDQYKGLTLNSNGELYLFKRNYESGEVRSFVKYDLNTSMETVITQLGTDYFDNFSSNGGDISSVYYPDTNEVIALVDFNTLLKIDISNGTISTDILSNSDYDQYKGLTLNSEGELYLYKRNYESGEVRNFVKYDLNTSMETVITQLGTDYFDNFSSNGGDISSVYYPDTNEVIALVDFNTLLKINTSNGTISTDILSNNDYDQYKGLTLK